MSRSYKHNPFCTDHSKHSAKWAKKQANRKVRHSKDFLNGNGYRKIYNSWNIRDWIWRESKYDAMAWYAKISSEGYPYKFWTEKYSTFEDYMNKCWAHDFYRK